MIAPCKGCGERKPACWDKCPKYKAWKDYQEAGKAEERKQAEYHYEFKRKAIDKWKKSLKRPSNRRKDK